jgi:hypothetical protein
VKGRRKVIVERPRCHGSVAFATASELEDPEFESQCSSSAHFRMLF